MFIMYKNESTLTDRFIAIKQLCHESYFHKVIISYFLYWNYN